MAIRWAWGVALALGLLGRMPAGGVNLELEALVDEALSRNPAVQAAAFEADRARAERAELRGFFDPQLDAALRHTLDHGDIGQTWLQAGASAAFQPGFTLGIQARELYYSTNGLYAGSNDLWQSRLALQAAVPLLRDRGFRQWRLSDERAAKRYRLAQHRWRAAAQQCRYDVERQYIAALEAAAQVQVSEAALLRVKKLLFEAEELVRLNIVPGYQVFAARSEVALWRELAAAARQASRSAQNRLSSLLGRPEPGAPAPASFDKLILWAESVDLVPDYDERDAFQARGDYAQLEDQIGVIEREQALNRDAQRDSLSLGVDVSLQGEDRDRVWATDRVLSERSVSAGAGLVWQRPWGYRTERARMRALAADLAAARERLRIATRSELKIQHEAFAVAQDRFGLLAEAIAAAEQALEAENERFSLGEGRSRNVLDAQKDLTDAMKRQIVIAVDLLNAYAAFRFAAGYAGEDR